MHGMRRHILTVGVNPSVDKTVTVDAMRISHENRASLVGAEAGGKAINVARALSRMRRDAAALLAIGTGHNGAFIKESLARERFATIPVTTSGDNRMNLTVRCGNEETRILEQGSALSAKDAAAVLAAYRKALPAADAVIVSGRNAAGLPDDFCAALIEHAHRRGIVTALDTSGTALAAGLRACPDIIKPNIKEAEELLGKRLTSQKTITAALRELRTRGIAIPLISAGKDGAYAFDGTTLVHAAPPAVKALTTVGCGDCFLAGFVASLTRGKSLADAMREATAWAAANTLLHVHGGITPARVARLRADVRITELSV